MGLVTQRSPAIGAAHECIIRQPGIVDLPDALGFEVGADAVSDANRGTASAQLEGQQPARLTDAPRPVKMRPPGASPYGKFL
jgi:hypothetical protein